MHTHTHNVISVLDIFHLAVMTLTEYYMCALILVTFVSSSVTIALKVHVIRSGIDGKHKSMFKIIKC